ncbi:MAG: PilN domain-containing protein, partial [Neisseriaceae bacterium]|nr:PilN domain-containing protein [Neisseriaceae bacterium]
QQQKKSFERLMVLGALAGIGLAALTYMVLSGAIATQNSRNESLEAGIKTLDAEIAEVKELRERKRQFLARKRKIEELDVKRFEGARVLDTLDQVDPEGAYITALEVSKKNGRNSKENRTYTISGRAVSDNKVALLMTALPSTGVFDQPELLSIKKGDGAQEFSLQAVLMEQKLHVDTDVSTSASSPSESQQGAQ